MKIIVVHQLIGPFELPWNANQQDNSDWWSRNARKIRKSKQQKVRFFGSCTSEKVGKLYETYRQLWFIRLFVVILFESTRIPYGLPLYVRNWREKKSGVTNICNLYNQHTTSLIKLYENIVIRTEYIEKAWWLMCVLRFIVQWTNVCAYGIVIIWLHCYEYK